MSFHEEHNYQKIGYSLPLGFLCNKILKKEDELYFNFFGSAEDCIKLLKNNNVSSIEIRSFKEDTSISDAIDVFYKIIKSGMGLTIHGFLPEIGKLDNKSKTIFQIYKELGKLNKPMIITLHAYRSMSDSKKKVLSKTTASLSQLIEKIGDFINIHIALEINKAKECNDPSFFYDDLLIIKEKVGSPRLGFCWDMGHSYWNVLHNNLSSVPPNEFINSVIHTHLHGLSNLGQTHWPLTEGGLPLEKYLHYLRMNNYTGIFNIELGLKRWHNEISVSNGIFGSINLLNKVLHINKLH